MAPASLASKPGGGDGPQGGAPSTAAGASRKLPKSSVAAKTGPAESPAGNTQTGPVNAPSSTASLASTSPYSLRAPFSAAVNSPRARFAEAPLPMRSALAKPDPDNASQCASARSKATRIKEPSIHADTEEAASQHQPQEPSEKPVTEGGNPLDSDDGRETVEQADAVTNFSPLTAPTMRDNPFSVSAQSAPADPYSAPPDAFSATDAASKRAKSVASKRSRAASEKQSVATGAGGGEEDEEAGDEPGAAEEAGDQEEEGGSLKDNGDGAGEGSSENSASRAPLAVSKSSDNAFEARSDPGFGYSGESEHRALPSAASSIDPNADLGGMEPHFPQPPAPPPLPFAHSRPCDDCGLHSIQVQCPTCGLHLCQPCSNAIHARKAFSQHALTLLPPNPDARESGLCTLCSTNRAVSTCPSCPYSPALCVRCWYASHNSRETVDHRPKLLLWPCERCYALVQSVTRQRAPPASWTCFSCKPEGHKLCRKCWSAVHADDARPDLQRHRPCEIYEEGNSPLLLVQHAKRKEGNSRSPTGGRGDELVARPQAYSIQSMRSQSGEIELGSEDRSREARWEQSVEHRLNALEGVRSDSANQISAGRSNVSVTRSSAGRLRRVDADMRYRLLQFFNARCPDKLPSVVPTLLAYEGREEELFSRLCAAYGPEPISDLLAEPLPPGWRVVQSPRGDVFYIHDSGAKQWRHPNPSLSSLASLPAARLAILGHPALMYRETGLL
ncbi:hypothetical protein DIPPA_15629 [Diplonema papillatum]|nr:hypothetical protein DIPPA_15629 [Diplonema papillatum]|eukprot:gene8950-13854_t